MAVPPVARRTVRGPSSASSIWTVTAAVALGFHSSSSAGVMAMVAAAPCGGGCNWVAPVAFLANPGNDAEQKDRPSRQPCGAAAGVEVRPSACWPAPSAAGAKTNLAGADRRRRGFWMQEIAEGQQTAAGVVTEGHKQRPAIALRRWRPVPGIPARAPLRRGSPPGGRRSSAQPRAGYALPPKAPGRFDDPLEVLFGARAHQQGRRHLR